VNAWAVFFILPVMAFCTAGGFGYRWIHKHAITWHLPIPEGKYSHCQACGERIMGCQHFGPGVPSTWEHTKTGKVNGPDGHRATHR
jgi:hypothetical protein